MDVTKRWNRAIPQGWLRFCYVFMNSSDSFYCRLSDLVTESYIIGKRTGRRESEFTELPSLVSRAW